MWNGEKNFIDGKDRGEFYNPGSIVKLGADVFGYLVEKIYRINFRLLANANSDARNRAIIISNATKIFVSESVFLCINKIFVIVSSISVVVYLVFVS